MPLGTQAKQDMRDMITLLNGIAYASNAAAASAKQYERNLNELFNIGKSRASFQELQSGFKNVANFAGLSQKEIKKYTAVIRDMASQGNLFGGTTGFQKNIFESLKSFRLPTTIMQKAKQDLLALSNLINQTPAASNDAQKAFNSLANSLERLGKGWTVQKGLSTLIADLNSVGRAIGVDKDKLLEFTRYLEHLAVIGKIPIDIKMGGGRGQTNITKVNSQGMEVPAYENILRLPEAAGAIPGGVTAINNIEKALQGYKSSLADLRQVHSDVAAGTTRWTARLKSIPGVVREVNLVTGSMGQILHSTARGFRSFGSAVARDMSEFLKWSIAAYAIYAPVRKLNELFDEAVEIQTKLADIQIAVGGSASQSARAYTEAAKVAEKFGVALAGVMDGYVLAYRAAGQIVDPTERAALATKLLEDSMMLSKLSGMEQAAALDTLTGALRQLGWDLDRGVELLDKWVAITKVANVDLRTLSESFAITATAAGNVGLNIDRLNAIIATVAETTTLSATEAGNAVRAFMSGFTREDSAKSLQEFGISVKDAAGELKSFDQISREVYERRQLGLIDDQAFAKLSETLGGRGARRGAQVQAYLSNLPRVEQLATVSLNAHGDAADALEIQLGTLQTALTRLGVAFSNLGRTLGADGGFLDLFEGIVKLGTGAVNMFSGLTKVLGTATPAILAFAAAMLILKKNSFITGQLALSPLELLGGVPTVTPTKMGVRMGMDLPQGRISGRVAGQLKDTAFGNRPLGESLGTFFSAKGGAAAGALTGAMMVAMSGALDGSKQQWGKAGALVGSSIIGTVIAGGNPIGGVIGYWIVNSILENLTNREVDLAAAFQRALAPPSTGPKTPEEEAASAKERNDALVEEIHSILSETIGGINLGLGEFAVNFGAQLASGKSALFGKPEQDEIEDFLIGILGAVTGRGRPGGVESTDLERRQAKMLFPTITDEQRTQLDRIYTEFLSGAEAAVKRASSDALARTRWGELIEKSFIANAPTAGAVFGAQKATTTGQIGRGEAGVRDLQNLMNKESGFASQVSTIYAAMIADNGKAELSFKELAELVISLSEEEAEAILATANAIGEKIAAIEALGDAYIDDVGTRKQRNELLYEELELQRQLNALTGQAAAGKKYKEFEQPDYVEVAAGTSPKQLEAAAREAARLTRLQAESITSDPAEIQKILDSFGTIAFNTFNAITGEWRKLPGEWENVNKEILMKQLEVAGVLTESMRVGLETPDLPSSEFGQLQGNIEFYRKLLSSTPAGAELLAQEKPEKLAILFSDNIVKELITSRTLFSLALRDIIKNQEEQLEGIFNIPEGMTAMIPYTGKLYFSDQPINREGTGGYLPDLGPPVDEFGVSTGIFSSAVDRFAGLIGATPAGAAAQDAKLTRMEEEFERDWLASHPPTTTTPPLDDTELYAAKEAEYAERFATVPAAEIDHYGGRGGMRPPAAETDVSFMDSILQILQEFLGGRDIDMSMMSKEIPALFGPGMPGWKILNDLLKKAQAGASVGPVGDAGSAAMQGAMGGATVWLERLMPLLALAQQLGGSNVNPDYIKQLQESGEITPRAAGEAPRENQIIPTEWIDWFKNLFGMAAAEGASGGSGVTGGRGTMLPNEKEKAEYLNQAAAAAPMSLPVTINTKIVNQISVLLDGFKIQQAINDRQDTTLATAVRRAGTSGFIVEA